MEVVLESFSAIQKQNQNYQIMGISISTFFFFFFGHTNWEPLSPSKACQNFDTRHLPWTPCFLHPFA